MIVAIVVAAGSSRRMGADKLSAPLAGRSVLELAVRAVAAASLFQEIILVTSSERWIHAREWINALEKEFRIGIRFCQGGAQRQDSVAAGLAMIDSQAEWVAVHDGARPLVTTDDVARVVSAARQCGAASLAHPVVETLKRADGRGRVTGSVDREDLWAMETPQVFSVQLLRGAYDSAFARGERLTDEVSAVQAAGHEIQLIRSSSLNLKITHPRDLDMAAAIIGRITVAGEVI